MTDNEDFGAMLAQYDVGVTARPTVGARVSAKVIHVTKDTVFFALNARDEAFMPKIALGDRQLAVGDTLEAMVVSTREGVELGLKLGRDQASVEALEQAIAGRVPVDGVVTAVNKGGVEVKIGAVSAFCPMGQLDLSFVDEPDKLIGKSLQFLVREVREGGRKVVVSRRALLEAERREKAKVLRTELAVGQRRVGKVTRVLDFGAFVDLGGIEGLIPVSELSHVHVADAASVVRAGDEVTVDVLRIEDDPKRAGEQRVALSLKATLPDPFIAIAGALRVGATVEGKVQKLEPFGAFVEIAPGVSGLVHVSELAHKRVRHPSDVLALGQQVVARVLSVDHERKRISLSIKEAGQVASATGAAGPTVGQRVEATVERIDKPGVFVTLEGGGSALLPAAETGTPPGTELARAFPPGTKLTVLVHSVDERGRVRVSKRAAERAEERDLVASYNAAQGDRGFGTLGSLLGAKLKK